MIRIECNAGRLPTQEATFTIRISRDGQGDSLPASLVDERGPIEERFRHW
jgi:hypothetical protein